MAELGISNETGFHPINDVCGTRTLHCVLTAERGRMWWGQEDLPHTHSAEAAPEPVLGAEILTV